MTRHFSGWLAALTTLASVSAGAAQPQTLPAEPPAFVEPSAEPAAPVANDLFDFLSIGAGFNGSKDPQTLGIDAHNGFRTEINWGIPLWRDWGVGVQVGTAFNYEKSAVRVLQSLDGTDDRAQIFSTIGLYQRAANGWHWGIAYDWLHETYFDNFDVTQWRAQVGYQFTDSDEVGVWATTRDQRADVRLVTTPFAFSPTSQVNAFWRHVWWHNIETRFWVGYVPQHSEFLFVEGGNPVARGQLSYGSQIFVPLSDSVAIWGEANFILPTNSGTVNAALGLAFYPGGRTLQQTVRNTFAPLFRVANNATMSIDVRP
jgi:hypothetical protein